MLLKVMYGQEKDGSFSAVTMFAGHTKCFSSKNLVSLKQSAGSFLGKAHRAGALLGITGIQFVEGIPNENTVWLIDGGKPAVKYNKPKRGGTRKAISVFVDEMVFNSTWAADKAFRFPVGSVAHTLAAGRNEFRGHTIGWAKNKPVVAPAPKKSDDESVEYFYKVENGYLKVYRKTLCQEFKISTIN